MLSPLGVSNVSDKKTPRVGLEPTTTRLTAECSAIELLRNIESGDELSSRAVTSQVLSTRRSLTSVFGMGTGGTPWLNHRNGMVCFQRTLKTALLFNSLRSSPRPISTGQLRTLLHFHLRPINQIVFLGPYSIKDERSHLRGSFTLRCFQRLSRPYIATQLCPWQDNWCTRGTSIPVLSY